MLKAPGIRGVTRPSMVLSVIAVDTGEVLDFEILSLHCHQYSKHQLDDKDSPEHNLWKERHSAKCQINFVGSSGAWKEKEPGRFSKGLLKKEN